MTFSRNPYKHQNCGPHGFDWKKAGHPSQKEKGKRYYNIRGRLPIKERHELLPKEDVLELMAVK